MKSRKLLWDKLLTKHEIEKLAPAEKRARLRTSMDRKISYLEKLVRTRNPPTEKILKLAGTRSALRRWEDEKLMLWRWSVTDADVLYYPDSGELGERKKGPNFDFMVRWDAAIKTLRKHSNSVKDPPMHSETAARDELVNQYLLLVERNAFLEAEYLKLLKRTR